MSDYTGQTCIECHQQLDVTAFDGNRYCVNGNCRRYGLWSEAYERGGQVWLVGRDPFYNHSDNNLPSPKFKFARSKEITK